MANFILMPQKGVSEESALLASWLVKEGDTISEGQAIFSLETGKSSFEEESMYSGTLLKILAAEGEEIAVGAPVAVIGTPGEKYELPAGTAPSASAATSASAAPAAEPAPAAPAPAPAAAPAVAAPAADGFVAASPRARQLAADLNLNLADATPTGPEGRIIERDVKALKAAGPAAAPAAAPAPAAAAAASPAAPGAEYTEEPITRMRKVIAENMHSSLATMAQLTLNRTFDASAINALRAKMKKSEGFGLEKVTINDFILLAVARTLPDFPDINANFVDGKMRRFNTVNLGVAVDTPKGLIVPVLRNAEKMSLKDISNAVKAKAKAGREGTISAAEFANGSFTVSNLGVYGIESFTPIINPPQTAILGVCGITMRPREDAEGDIEFYPAMGLSLTFDHRVVDGAPAAQFLKAVAEKLENIELVMAL